MNSFLTTLYFQLFKVQQKIRDKKEVIAMANELDYLLSEQEMKHLLDKEGLLINLITEYTIQLKADLHG